MSKTPKNLEKIILGVAVLAGGALVATGVMKKGQVDEDFSSNSSSSGGGETSVAGADLVPATINSLQLDRSWAPATVPSTRLASGERPVNLFVGIPLFASRDNPNEPVDPLTSPDVHPPIPNEWWLEHGVSPNFADSPQRDADDDGFTNLEEFEAKTNPADATSHPPLIQKLAYVGDEAEEWIVEWSFESEGKWIPKYADGKGGKNKVDFGSAIAPGGTFFAEEPAKDRFKFIGFEDRTVRNERVNIDEKVRYAIFEDQKENKKGLKYEMPQRFPRAQRPDYIQYDRTAILDLRAIGRSGQTFKVEERTAFSLPAGEAEKGYFLKEVTPDAITVEWTEDGEARSVTISKTGTGA